MNNIIKFYNNYFFYISFFIIDKGLLLTLKNIGQEKTRYFIFKSEKKKFF